MEIKEWTYEAFPSFDEEIEGVEKIATTGDEIGVRYIPDVTYAQIEGTSLTLQILRPYTRNHHDSVVPCVLYVQGSGWMKQDLYGQIPALSKLAERGYVVALVEYRHSGIATFPAQVLDARNALRFMRVHAEEYKIDADNMFIAGDSSGGHTAMFAGMMHHDDRLDNLFPGVSAEVRGIINWYGSVSVMLEEGTPSTLNHYLPDSPEGLEMGGVSLRGRPDLCTRLSVEENIFAETKIAPVLMFHGTKDRIINTKVSVLLYRKLKETGKDVRFYLLQGADHGGPEFWTKQVVDIIDNFIQKQSVLHERKK